MGWEAQNRPGQLVGPDREGHYQRGRHREARAPEAGGRVDSKNQAEGGSDTEGDAAEEAEGEIRLARAWKLRELKSKEDGDGRDNEHRAALERKRATLPAEDGS